MIDDNVSPPKNLDRLTSEEHLFIVHDTLINWVDQTYHPKILKIEDPRAILKTLKEIKRCENNVISVMIRRQLYTSHYNPNRETTVQFWERIEDLVRNYETISEDEEEFMQ